MPKRIVVVDDEPDFCFFLKKNLEATGAYEVSVCMEAAQAVSQVRTLKPDLVLLDILMPGRSGAEIAEELKHDAATKTIPVIFLTAVVTPEEAESQRHVIGGHRFIAKPVRVAELIGVIEGAMAPPPGSSPKAMPGERPSGPQPGGGVAKPRGFTPSDRPRSGESGLTGFTLIELMLVIVIIAALASMVVPRLAGRSEEAKIGAAKADIKGNLSLALRLYEVDNGQYPTSEQGLQALLQKPASPPLSTNWRGPYIEQDPVDPWGRPYVYAYPGTHPPRDYDLYSLGPDGVEGTDDVTNW